MENYLPCIKTKQAYWVHWKCILITKKGLVLGLWFLNVFSICLFLWHLTVQM